MVLVLISDPLCFMTSQNGVLKGQRTWFGLECFFFSTVSSISFHWFDWVMKRVVVLHAYDWLIPFSMKHNINSGSYSLIHEELELLTNICDFTTLFFCVFETRVLWMISVFHQNWFCSKEPLPSLSQCFRQTLLSSIRAGYQKR